MLMPSSPSTKKPPAKIRMARLVRQLVRLNVLRRPPSPSVAEKADGTNTEKDEGGGFGSGSDRRIQRSVAIRVTTVDAEVDGVSGCDWHGKSEAS